MSRAATPADAIASTDNLLRRGPFLAVLLQGLPLAVGLASHAVINLIDLALVGRLGDGALQAAHVATTWNFLPMIVGQCVSTALLAQLSRRLGEGDHRGARAYNLSAQWFMLWFGLAVALLTALPAVWQVDATGVSGSARSDAVHYLIVSNLGCLPMFVLMQTTAAMRAAGEALAPLSLLLLANLLNLVLDLVLLFGWDAVGIPSIGVVGAAYASVASRCLAAALAIAWLRRRRHVLSLRGERSAGVGPIARPLLVDAWPQILQIGLRASIVVAITVMVQRDFGDEATVSLSIATRLDTLVLFSSLGFANAATAYAGRAVVMGWPGRARLAGMWAALQSMAFGALFVCFYQSETETVVGWFRPEPSFRLVFLTSTYFQIAAWSQVFGAGALGAIGAVHGAGRMIAPLVVDLVGFGVAGLLLWATAQTDSNLGDYYYALLYGMVAVVGCQLLHLALGRWPLSR